MTDADSMTLLGKVVAAAMIAIAPFIAALIWFDRSFVRRAEAEAIWKELDYRREKSSEIEKVFQEHIDEERDRQDKYHAENLTRLTQIERSLAHMEGKLNNRLKP